MDRDPSRILGRASRIGGVLPATSLANARGWGKALVVEKVMRVLKPHHESDVPVGPISDETPEVAVPISPAREKGAIPEHGIGRKT